MKIGKSSIIFENVYLKSSAVVVGPKEKKGPLEKYFDYCFDKLNCNEKSWEKAEIKMYNTAASIALKKNRINEKDIELVVSGDLNNQIIIGSYAMRDYDTPYLGIFSACASSVEGLIMASLLIDRCGYHNIMVNVSSHNAMAEKHFRYPNEYGCQKPKYITSTVTSSTSVILSSDFSDQYKYFDFNKTKLDFDPVIYEFIGEFDIVLNELLFKKIQSKGLLSKEFLPSHKFE